MAHRPTAEQQEVVDNCRDGRNLVVEAGAGSGKTTTLRMAAEVMDGDGAYIAYNSAIAKESAASFPRSVACSTAHSLAFRAVGKNYRERLNGPRQTARMAARALRITEAAQFDSVVIQPHQLARMAISAVDRFCQSADTEVSWRHVPVPDTIGQDIRPALQRAVAPFAVKAWNDLTHRSGELKFQHDHYLKMWQLSNPKIECDYVFLDEAQDANPVIASIVLNQTHAQRIAVGDSCQQLYGWRGATDALKTWPADKRLYLSQSFRFGPAIADEANKWLSLLDSPLRLSGFPVVYSVVGDVESPDAVLCRTNAEAMNRAIAAMDDGRSVALVGGGTQIKRLAEAALTLRHGQGTDHPELFVFGTWGEVQDYVTHEDAGSDLKVFVQLIDKYGAEVVIAAVDRLSEECRADLIVSTAHRSKGREWGSVRIATDFKAPKNVDGEPGPVPGTDAMLAYVAVTRAKNQLDRGGLAWVDRYIPAGVG